MQISLKALMTLLYDNKVSFRVEPTSHNPENRKMLRFMDGFDNILYYDLLTEEIILGNKAPKWREYIQNAIAKAKLSGTPTVIIGNGSA